MPRAGNPLNLYQVRHILSVPPHIFAPRNLKWSDKDMKQVKYDKVYEITDSLQRV